MPWMKATPGKRPKSASPMSPDALTYHVISAPGPRAGPGQVMAIRLPLEILIAIVKEVDDVQTLRQFRVVSRALCAVATPLAFPTLSVITTSSSAQNLRRLFDLPDIAAHVKEVHYHDTGADRGGRMLECGASSPLIIPQQFHDFSLCIRGGG